MRSLVSWSGGKDSCFATMKAREAGYEPTVLLNVMNESGQRSRSHGLPASVLKQQADAMHLPITLIESSWKEYEMNFTNALLDLRKRFNTTYAVFGDIDLQAHRDWEEKVTAAAGLQAALPLWQQNRKTLLIQMLNAGIETMIVSCNAVMGPSFLGRTMTEDMIPELENMGVDVCGENGEFHTLVVNCPLFDRRITVQPGEIQEHEGYWFLEIT
ncbi:MAG: diphthine--ammonia ligase [Chitinophagaceae bacterium]|nr:diphthine--ammonia ligase [Chitinophagaceae bacterium]